MNFFTNSLSNGTENIKIHRDSIENEPIIFLGGKFNFPPPQLHQDPSPRFNRNNAKFAEEKQEN